MLIDTEGDNVRKERRLMPLRLPTDLIEAIRQRAAEEERSFNAWVVRALRRAVRHRPTERKDG